MGIKVNDIAFVRFQAPDLAVMQAFCQDFGMTVAQRTDDTLYMRGTDDEGFVHVTHLAAEAGFVGLAFLANSVDDLEALAALGEFSAVEKLDGPGTGRVVRATDPDGFQVEVVAGRGSVGRLPVPEPAIRNDAVTHPRQGSPLRVGGGPSHVKRLGHGVLNVTDYRASEAWYKEQLGLVTSDEIQLDENTAFGAFLRCDRGEEYVDHHTLFLLGIGKAEFNHAAFEVSDFDDLMAGYSHLTTAGRHAQWGIGRHILGSQIYDYWLDPYGHMVEHWTDGDLFNNATPPNAADLGALLGSQWGPTHGGPPL
ncbi:MAG: VOC family protein [Ilumatobacteraceae bacterium]|nr:VOC family protein [Ilumatobacteraceae bacterium]